MLAPKQLPIEYEGWNRRWGAPSGRPIRVLSRLPGVSQRTLRWRFPRLTGPFGFQRNNSTRAFEYPWAFHSVPVGSGVVAVELGGSLSGFQFALAKSGARVTNVDPGEEASGVGWPVSQDAILRLNRAFGTEVRLIGSTLGEANFDDDSVDVVYAISVIEHIPPAEIPDLMREIRRVLRPGGHCILTVDLFLNLHPFSDRAENEFGSNIAPRLIVESSDLEMVAGNPGELLGFPAFDPKAVLAHLEHYLVGGYPALAQCFVLRKPASA